MTRSPGAARRTARPVHAVRLVLERWRRGLGGRLTDRRSRSAARRYGHDGGEPATARSDLRMRMILAGTAVPLYLLGAVGFGAWALLGPRGHPPDGMLWAFASLCALLSLIAAADVLLVRRRREEQHRWHR